MKDVLTRGVMCVGLGLALLTGCEESANVKATTPAEAPHASWVGRSDENAKVLLEADAQFLPELAARLGVDGLDDHVIDLAPGHQARQRAAIQKALEEIRRRATAETEPPVKQDLAILEHAADLTIRQIDADEKYVVPYHNLTRLVFSSVQSLLDDQIPMGRRKAIITRLNRYAGREAGYTPIVDLAKAETLAAIDKPGLSRPSRLEVENDLQRNRFMREGMRKLFEKHLQLEKQAYDEPLHAIEIALSQYDAWVESEILPKARADFAQPPAIYALSLEDFGVDIAPEELATHAHAAFTEIQAKMQKVAAEVAKAKGFASADYHDVIRELKKEQLGDDVILEHYKKRLADIERIIKLERLVTLPSRPARIRLGTPAENAEQPAAHMKPPRLIGNTGEQGEFVLPLSLPGDSSASGRMNDSSYAAGSWTLTAHEARPGHELQFSAIVERGVSIARMVYAFNSTNVEGWGLYSEHITLPFMPADGQLVSLQLRALRAARAFLDPELQAGKVTPEQARAFLENEVVVSPAMARQEVERYTFRSPGQATSYFYGYTRLLELRRDVEAKMGPKFDALRFHDFILAQGLLPPKLLREAVMRDFVGR